MRSFMTRKHSVWGLVGVLTVSAIAGVVAAKTSDAEDPTSGRPLALVVEVSGDADVRKDTQEPRPLAILDRLSRGDVVTTGDDAEVVLAFLDGRRYRLEGEVEAKVADNGLAVAAGTVTQLPQVETSPAISAIPATRSPGMSSGAARIRTLRTSVRGVENLYPHSFVAVRADRAVLSFDPVADATSYRVEVEDDSGESVFALDTLSCRVVVPQGALNPGAEYYWWVRTVTSGSSRVWGDAFFQTLGAPEAEWLDRVEEQLSAERSAHAVLLLAEIYNGLGMHREACEAVRGLDQLQQAGGSRFSLCDQYFARSE
jgi:hypothetical protein